MLLIGEKDKPRIKNLLRLSHIKPRLTIALLLAQVRIAPSIRSHYKLWVRRRLGTFFTSHVDQMFLAESWQWNHLDPVLFDMLL